MSEEDEVELVARAIARSKCEPLLQSEISIGLFVDKRWDEYVDEARVAIGIKSSGEGISTMSEGSWDGVMGMVHHELEMALARHPKVGAALSFADGEKLITDLSAKIALTARRLVDPKYDG